jgi:hypothetical protein
LLRLGAFKYFLASLLRDGLRDIRNHHPRDLLEGGQEEETCKGIENVAGVLQLASYRLSHYASVAVAPSPWRHTTLCSLLCLQSA